MARNAGWCFTFLEVISSSMKKQAANDIFARLADYFKQNFTEKLDMREVASLFSVNLDEMNLTFRTQFGITPYQYLIRLEAYKLIKHLIGEKEYEGFRIWW